MTTPRDDAPAPSPDEIPRTEVVPVGAARDLPEAVVVRLAQAMAAAWRRGERPLAEEFLACHRDLRGNRVAVLCLLREEIALREEFGEPAPAADLMLRFPEWEADVRGLLDSGPAATPGGVPPGVAADFDILRELGEGAQGRVYLARQRPLAERLVVLKVTDRGGREHLSLARLQHTHIVPLYWAEDDPGADRRTLCMPFLGSATLHALLVAFAGTPPAARTGADFLVALDAIHVADAVGGASARGPARQRLWRATYGQAVAWVGACLAEGLQYAHERGLVHLDVKPSNVLLAADATPMLLDFHLARPPLRAGEAAPWGVGGTPLYMAPEQRAAVEAASARKPIPTAVDGRSDLYSLGLVLYQALGGPIPLPTPVPRLERVNGQVSVGLADVVHRCLEADPTRRYADAAALATDLRRHLADLPLRGVPNRSLTERWAKWRRRRPHALPLLILVAALLASGVGAGLLHHARREAVRVERLGHIEEALAGGEELLHAGEYGKAAERFRRGLELAAEVPGADGLADRLRSGQRRGRRLDLAKRLRRLADALRLAALRDRLPERQVRDLEEGCRALWQARDRILAPHDGRGPDRAPLADVRTDLLDLVVLRAELLSRLAPGGVRKEVCAEALANLNEAERLFGASAALARVRRDLAAALGQSEAGAVRLAAAVPPPRTAWEHCDAGRALLRRGRLDAAAAEFEAAARREPSGYWPHFYEGVCAFRRERHAEAVAAFGACVALAPGAAAAWHNRGLAHERLGDDRHALADYDRALELSPDLAEAALSRAALHYRHGRYDLALADARRALAHGADPAGAHYLAARIQLARGDRAAALASVGQALAARPDHADAVALARRLQDPAEMR